MKPQTWGIAGTKIKAGQLVYQDQDNKVYPVDPRDVNSWFRRLLAWLGLIRTPQTPIGIALRDRKQGKWVSITLFDDHGLGEYRDSSQ